jgi:hypothetical protein
LNPKYANDEPIPIHTQTTTLTIKNDESSEEIKIESEKMGIEVSEETKEVPS